MISFQSLLNDVSSAFKSIINLLSGFILGSLHTFVNTIRSIGNGIQSSFTNGTSGIARSVLLVFLPFNFLWFSAIPSDYIKFVAPASLLIAGYLSERHFISRTTVFTNAIALNVFLFYLNATTIFTGFALTVATYLFVWYANIGLIMAVIALYSYKTRGKNSKLFYTIAWAYSSVVVAIIIIGLSWATY